MHRDSLSLKAWGGSGVITGRHTILTASHVVHCDGEVRLFVRTLEGDRLKAHTVVEAGEFDLAKLETEEELPPAPQFLIGKPPKRGDVVCHEAAAPIRIRTCGAVKRTAREPSDRDIWHSADTIQGNSGGPLFDAKGYLVGIVTYMVQDIGVHDGQAASLWSHRKVMQVSY
jgi:S1-C subfamily serine protease